MGQLQDTTDRARPRAEPAEPPQMSQALEALLDRLAADLDRHLLAGPAEEPELSHLEQSLRLRLPAGFRALLRRLGGGILYDRHEVFGPRPLQLHDIEFVPALAAVQGRLRAGLGPGLLAFHRGGGLVHAFDLRLGGDEPVPIVSMDGAAHYPSLEGFLEAVVLTPVA